MPGQVFGDDYLSLKCIIGQFYFIAEYYDIHKEYSNDTVVKWLKMAFKEKYWFAHSLWIWNKHIYSKASCRQDTG